MLWNHLFYRSMVVMIVSVSMAMSHMMIMVLMTMSQMLVSMGIMILMIVLIMKGVIGCGRVMRHISGHMRRVIILVIVQLLMFLRLMRFTLIVVHLLLLNSYLGRCGWGLGIGILVTIEITIQLLLSKWRYSLFH